MASTDNFWRKFFEKRPDLKPPGYEETLIKMGYQEPEPEPEEIDIEF